MENDIGKNGLPWLSFGEKHIEAYFVGDINDAAKLKEFTDGIKRATASVGSNSRGLEETFQRFWPYGKGDGAIGFPAARGNIPAPSGKVYETSKQVAEHLNVGKPVKIFPQNGIIAKGLPGKAPKFAFYRGVLTKKGVFFRESL